MNQAAVERIERLIEAIESAPDSKTRASALELVQAVLAVHGEGLKRVLTLLQDGGDVGAEFIQKLCRNDLISSLLSLHDLHPEGLRSRAERAITQLREGGLNVELPRISEDGVITVHLSDSSQRVRKVVEDSLLAAVPDAAGIVFEPEPHSGFVPLNAISGNGLR